jgi:N-acetylmuramoyl-L-alanine amidase
LPKYTKRKKTEVIVIHCAMTSAEQTHVDAAEIRRWHVEERGWADIGYHWVIKRDGKLEAGRPEWAVGAHVENHNHNSIGICLVGGCDERGREQNNFTPEQWATLEGLVVLMCQLYKTTDVRGHRDFPGVKKYCPSFDAIDWWRGVLGTAIGQTLGKD